MEARRRRHPLLRAVVFGTVAVYALALGVYGAVAIPHRRLVVLDYGSPRGSRFWLENPDNHIALRILCLVGGFAVALLLARAANASRFRRERLGLRAPG